MKVLIPSFSGHKHLFPLSIYPKVELLRRRVYCQFLEVAEIICTVTCSEREFWSLHILTTFHVTSPVSLAILWSEVVPWR